MRILQVGKFYFPQGGADKYFLDLSRQLEKRGHTVAHFSLQHPKNEESAWSSYFAPQVYFNNSNLWQKVLAVWRRIFSGFVSKRLFEKLVRDFRPDIIHVHNICHYLSPSFLLVAQHYNIPVVMHLHDYSYISPNYYLFDERGDYHGGKKEHYFECVKDRCFKHSYIESFFVALEMYWQHTVTRIFEKNITVYVAPSFCMQEQMQLWRPDIHNIKVIPHGVPIKPLPIERRDAGYEQYYLYIGRLSREKGVSTLIRAFASLVQKDTQLKIVGEGPMHKELEDLAKQLNVENRIQFLGFKSGDELEKIIEESCALVVPSEWKEVFGLVVIEGMERGKAVIASRTGAIPEIIEDKKTGLLFTKGDVLDLAKTMDFVTRNPSVAQEIGERARVRAEEMYSYSKHIIAIEKLYQDIVHKIE